MPALFTLSKIGMRFGKAPERQTIRDESLDLRRQKERLSCETWLSEAPTKYEVNMLTPAHALAIHYSATSAVLLHTQGQRGLWRPGDSFLFRPSCT